MVRQFEFMYSELANTLLPSERGLGYGKWRVNDDEITLRRLKGRKILGLGISAMDSHGYQHINHGGYAHLSSLANLGYRRDTVSSDLVPDYSWHEPVRAHLRTCVMAYFSHTDETRLEADILNGAFVLQRDVVPRAFRRALEELLAEEALGKSRRIMDRYDEVAELILDKKTADRNHVILVKAKSEEMEAGLAVAAKALADAREHMSAFRHGRAQDMRGYYLKARENSVQACKLKNKLLAEYDRTLSPTIAAIQDRAVAWWDEQAPHVAELIAFLEEYADDTGAPDWSKLSAAKLKRKVEVRAEYKAKAKVERLKRQEEDRERRKHEEEQRKREEREQRRSQMTAERRERDERKEREREARKRWARNAREAPAEPEVDPEPTITRITREIIASILRAGASHTLYCAAEHSGDLRLPYFQAVEWHLEHATRRARRELKPLGAAAFTEREIAAWAESMKALAEHNAVITALIEFLHEQSPTPGASNWYDRAWEHLQGAKK